MQENGRVVCFHPNMKDPVICNTSQLKYIYIYIYISPKSHVYEMHEEKMALPCQVKNLNHFLQSGGCTREQQKQAESITSTAI